MLGKLSNLRVCACSHDFRLLGLDKVKMCTQQRKRTASGLAPRARVLAIGNTIIDTVMTMPSYPVDSKVWVSSKRRFVGGQGANAAQDMALLGVSVSFVTRIGDDPDGLWAKQHYKKCGMHVDHCITVPGAQTMSAVVVIETNTGQRSCLMHKDAGLFSYDVKLRVDEIAANVGDYQAIYTDGYQLDLVMPIVRLARKFGVRVVADIEEVDEETRELAMLATDVVAPAASISKLVGDDRPIAAAVEALAATQGRTVIGTLGDQGSCGFRYGESKPVHVPACSPKVLSTVGAGDAYHAGYIAAIAQDVIGLADQMEYATKVAAANCESVGPVVTPEALPRWV